ncbi:MAG: UDP-N-acetylmuramoyl-tripeptide--D-alanyl-D-alanine ligase [Candidatus Paceibacterota bacterium]|jgi:UDP-N-acetylmuramoyl-tripeptide--D-alanyl-D-alanine ligase
MRQVLKKILISTLKAESRLVIKRYKPKIITVSGNLGKTTTKDAIYTVLKDFYFVRKSEKNFISEIGAPLTILGCENAGKNYLGWVFNVIKGFWLILIKQDYPEWLVLEVGASAPGDIKLISSWLHSDVVVMTRFGEIPSHVEFFKSPEHFLKEKIGLIHSLKKDGTLILNADDPVIFKLKDEFKSKILSFGFNPEAKLMASNSQICYSPESKNPKGLNFKVNYDGHSLPVTMNRVLGNNHIYAGLASLAVAYLNDLNILEAISAIKKIKSPPGRLRIIDGLKDSIILDDTYNSSPMACETALSVLGEIDTKKRKIAILGDMLELGKYTEEAHKKIGELAVKNCDTLVTVGIRAQKIAEGALIGGMSEKNIFQMNDNKEAGKFVEKLIGKGDVVLVKGSQKMRMEKIVEDIMLHPEDKEDLLVRQGKEWDEN